MGTGTGGWGMRFPHREWEPNPNPGAEYEMIKFVINANVPMIACTQTKIINPNNDNRCKLD